MFTVKGLLEAGAEALCWNSGDEHINPRNALCGESCTTAEYNAHSADNAKRTEASKLVHAADAGGNADGASHLSLRHSPMHKKHTKLPLFSLARQGVVVGFVLVMSL